VVEFDANAGVVSALTLGSFVSYNRISGGRRTGRVF